MSIELNLFLHRNAVVVNLDGLQQTHIGMSFSSYFFNTKTISLLVSVGGNKKRDERIRLRAERKPMGREERDYLEFTEFKDALAISLSENSSDENRRNADAALMQREAQMRDIAELRKRERNLRGTTLKKVMENMCMWYIMKKMAIVSLVRGCAA